MRIINGMTFANNYARAAAYYLATLAPVPTGKTQKAAYDFISSIYAAIYDDAEALGIKTTPDVSFAPFETQKNREKDVKAIRDPIAKIEKLIADLFVIVETSDVDGDTLTLPEGISSPKGNLLKLLLTVGVKVEKGNRIKLILPENSVAGLRELTVISRKNTIHITDGPKEDKAHLFFSRCVFDPSEKWAEKAFDALLNANGELLRICEELEKRGYERIVCRDGKKIGFDYVKQHGKKPEPVKSAWAERTHSGIELTYEELISKSAYLWVRMPMFKTVLERSGELSAPVNEFISAHTKTCDGCRYCVQTDKTGTRPLAAIRVGDKKKCPYYPGFSMNWRELSPKLADDICALLDGVDSLKL